MRLARYAALRAFWFDTAKCQASSVFKNVARACQSRHSKPINTSETATRSVCFRKDEFRSLSQPWFARIVRAESSVGGRLAIGCDCSNCEILRKISRSALHLKPSIQYLHNFRADGFTLQHEPPYGNGQLESPWPCAAGIEIEHSAAHLLLGNVTVPVDHDSEPGRLRL